MDPRRLSLSSLNYDESYGGQPRRTFGSRAGASTLPSLPTNSSIEHLRSAASVNSSPTGIAQLHRADSPLCFEFNLDNENTDNHDQLADDSYVEFDLGERRALAGSMQPVAMEKSISKSSLLINNDSKESHRIPLQINHSHRLTTDFSLTVSAPEQGESISAEVVADDDDDFFALGNNWKAMKTIAELDFYNDRGELQYTSGGMFDKNGIITSNGVGIRGYTKIDTEEQTAKYAELDKKTDFLFQRASTDTPTPVAMAHYGEEDMEHEHEHEMHHHKDSDSDSEYDDDDNIQSNEALESTKHMLSDAQKFAYVGIAKLIAVDMATELAKLKSSTSNRIAKELSGGQKNFANWSAFVSMKLYEHLELTKDEQRMIENLSIHGLEVGDLTISIIGAKVQLPSARKRKNRKSKEKAQVDQDADLVWILICDLFLLLLSEGYYDARSRSLVLKFADYLKVSKIEIFQFERRLVDSLEMESKSDKLFENKEELLNDRQFIEKHIKKNKKRKLAYIGLATLGGGLAIGLSAGLLAPVIGAGLAAGLTTVGITGTTGFLAGVGGSAIITTGGVVAGARIGTRAGARRLGDVQTFELKPLHNNKRTNLILTVSGWMNGELDDVRLPFSTVDPVMGDMFSLFWEPEMLQSMGQTINILASEALTTSIQQILGATILTALMAAIQLPMALSKLSYLLDNPWNVSLDRAWKAGKILADTIIAGNLGVRPITLVGFSLGARLIYSCLIELGKRGGYGLIENVIILGSPVTVKIDQLAMARSVVSGKFVNGYSKRDWILGYLFRATGGGINTVAGLQEITSVYGIENVDCTEFVEGHMSYRKAIPKILKTLNWEVLSEEFAEIEEPDPEQGEKTRKLLHEFEEARAKMLEEQEGTQKTEKRNWKNWFNRSKKKEWWEGLEKPETSNQAEAAKQAEISNLSDSTDFEYNVEEDATAAPIFDLTALEQEVKNIEDLSKKGDNSLTGGTGEGNNEEVDIGAHGTDRKET